MLTGKLPLLKGLCYLNQYSDIIFTCKVCVADKFVYLLLQEWSERRAQKPELSALLSREQVVGSGNDCLLVTSRGMLKGN